MENWDTEKLLILIINDKNLFRKSKNILPAGLIFRPLRFIMNLNYDD